MSKKIIKPKTAIAVSKSLETTPFKDFGILKVKLRAGESNTVVGTCAICRAEYRLLENEAKFCHDNAILIAFILCKDCADIDVNNLNMRQITDLLKLKDSARRSAIWHDIEVQLAKIHNVH